MKKTERNDNIRLPSHPPYWRARAFFFFFFSPLRAHFYLVLVHKPTRRQEKVCEQEL